MLRIRLRRTGKKKQPNYRLVVAEHTAPIYGKYVDLVGHYNPFTKKIVIDTEKVKGWLKKGAKPSNTVAILLKKENLRHPSIVIKKIHIPTKTETKEREAEEAKEEAEKEAKKKEMEEKLEEFKEEQAEKAEEGAGAAEAETTAEAATEAAPEAAKPVKPEPEKTTEET